MAWYNPISWIKKKPAPTPIKTPAPTSTPSSTTQQTQKVDLYYNIDNPKEQYSRETNNPSAPYVPLKTPIQNPQNIAPRTNRSSGNPFVPTPAPTSTTQGTIANQSSSSGSTLLSQRLDKINQEVALGKPNVPKQSTFKKTTGQISDVWASGFAPVGAVWTDHFGRDTSIEAPELKEDFNKAVDKSVSDYIVFGIPGLAGFNAKGQFRTAWSKQGAGLPGATPLTNFQIESYKEARKLREAGDTTKAEQKIQSEKVQETIQDIEKREKDLFMANRPDIYGAQVEKFNEDINKNIAEVESYTKEVETFNKQYGGKQLRKNDYELALTESKKLEAERQELLNKQTTLESRKSLLQTKQKQLETAYGDYESQTLESIKELRKYGVETKINEQGEVMFNSKALQTQVKPIGWKVQESLKKGNKLSWKNIAYGGASVVPVVTEGVVLGLATGSTGVLAKIGGAIAKTPKLIKYGIYGGTTLLTLGGVASKGYAGYKYAKSSNLPGWFGATIGTTQAVGEVGGFAYGGAIGTKGYFSRIENKILEGKYTKSIGETRQGTIYKENGKNKGGTAEQLGIYETKVKGTKLKIKTGAHLKGMYGEDSGTSDIRIVSQIEGKSKGLPKSYVTQGKSLETSDWIKARLYSKPTKGKYWYEQDILIKRSILGQAKMNVKGKPGFEGFTDLERLNIMSGIRTSGKPMKVGKEIPKQIFSDEELFRFVNYKGKGKVMQPWEFGEAKPDSTASTTQLILYKESKPLTKGWYVGSQKVGEVASTSWTTQDFKSVSKSGSISNKLLKDLLKDKVLIIKDSTASMLSNKGGKVNSPLLWEVPKSQVSQGKKLSFGGLNPQIQIEDTLNQVLKIQLKNIVPRLLAQQTSWAMPGALATASGLGGLKNIIKSRQNLNLINESALLGDLNTKVLQRSIQVPMQDILPIQKTRISQLQAPIEQQALRLTTPTITTPVVNPIITTTQIPLFFNFDIPEGWGFEKERKQASKPKRRNTYLPDFTAKTLGIESQAMSSAQLKKLLKQTFSGLEVRPSLSWEIPKRRK